MKGNPSVTSTIPSNWKTLGIDWNQKREVKNEIGRSHQERQELINLTFFAIVGKWIERNMTELWVCEGSARYVIQMKLSK